MSFKRNISITYGKELSQTGVTPMQYGLLEIVRAKKQGKICGKVKVCIAQKSV
jgi:hypothetical protein